MQCSKKNSPVYAVSEVLWGSFRNVIDKAYLVKLHDRTRLERIKYVIDRYFGKYHNFTEFSGNTFLKNNSLLICCCVILLPTQFLHWWQYYFVFRANRIIFQKICCLFLIIHTIETVLTINMVNAFLDSPQIAGLQRCTCTYVIDWCFINGANALGIQVACCCQASPPSPSKSKLRF